MPPVTRRRMILAGSALALPWPARAQSFPTRAVTLVVSQGPGSGSDISARILATQMAPVLRQPVVVENRTAGGGIVAHQAIARGPADGHNVIFSSTAALLIQPVMNPAQYGLGDFAPVASVLRADLSWCWREHMPRRAQHRRSVAAAPDALG